HSTKVTECGCAAGCYTGGCAPQIYAMALEAAGCDLSTSAGVGMFTRFLCDNGPAFYGFEGSTETFTLKRETSSTKPHLTGDGPVVPLPHGMGLTLDWTVTAE